ncbi:MAG: dockerin type I repeat-containing protein [Oscillospiraceae bacterium]|nr:dockerin type I repeat-containing protein [Oscillospiraceae bacterium]
MRKFTNEIAALITTLAVGTVAGVITAAAAETSDGTSDNEPVFTTMTTTMPPLAGTMVSTTTTTTLPPLAGTLTTVPTTTLPPLAGTMVSTAATTTLPPLAGEMMPTETIEEIPPVEGLMVDNTGSGDFNGDGSFSVADVVLLQKYMLNLPELTIRDVSTADMNMDGRVNSKDYSLMKRRLLNETDELPRISMEDVIAISELKERISLKDFAGYKGKDIGSGLCVMEYLTNDENFRVLVGSQDNIEIAYVELESLCDGDSADMMKDDILMFYTDHKLTAINTVVTEIQDSRILVKTDKKEMIYVDSQLIAEPVQVGDTLKIVYRGLVMETYPLTIYTVSASILKRAADCAPCDFSRMDRLLSYWYGSVMVPFDNEAAMDDAANNHIPVKVIHSKAELNALKDKIQQAMGTGLEYMYFQSFETNTAKYDDTFFQENVLLIAAFEESSGSYRHHLSSLDVSDNTLMVTIQRNKDSGSFTCDMASWFCSIPYGKEQLDGLSIDAVLIK